MADRDHDRDRNGNQENRVDELKRQAEQVAGGNMVSWESDALSPEQREQFWERVVDAENEATTTLFQELLNAGVELPDPDVLDDRRLSSTLWKVIFAMAGMRVFLHWTDHLNDRELYFQLWHEILPEETTILPDDLLSEWHIDVPGSHESGIYLKYYADEKARRAWREDFPEDDVPAHENPPHDRDRLLPQPEW